jgi:hydantoinase/carbamoylase family amidase
MGIGEALEDAARFGGGEDGGVTRMAWDRTLFEVYEWLRARASECGFVSRIDAAGNLVVVWAAGEEPAVALGSHLDTVPSGGRFDGALGVLAGFEALRGLRDAGFEPSRPIWLLAFMDEEGARFGTSMFGSKAFVGEDVTHLTGRVDQAGVTLAEAMERAGFDPAEVVGATAIGQVGQYLELHIEQGPVLERNGEQVGVVSDICGLVGLRIRLSGEANHAGTTPMEMRRDALAGAARFIVALRGEMAARETCVGTVGMIEAEPGAFNVVPGAAEISVDIRAIRAEDLDGIERWVEEAVTAIAHEEGLDVAIERIHRLEPTAMAPELVDLLSRSATAEGATHRVMASGAGHDAMIIGRHVPAGMIFVPSAKGLSHNPGEWSDPGDCDLGMKVLRRAVAELAG